MKTANIVVDENVDAIRAMLKGLPEDQGARTAELYAARLEGFVEGLHAAEIRTNQPG